MRNTRRSVHFAAKPSTPWLLTFHCKIWYPRQTKSVKKSSKSWKTNKMSFWRRTSLIRILLSNLLNRKSKSLKKKSKNTSRIIKCSKLGPQWCRKSTSQPHRHSIPWNKTWRIRMIRWGHWRPKKTTASPGYKKSRKSCSWSNSLSARKNKVLKSCWQNRGKGTRKSSS